MEVVWVLRLNNFPRPEAKSTLVRFCRLTRMEVCIP